MKKKFISIALMLFVSLATMIAQLPDPGGDPGAEGGGDGGATGGAGVPLDGGVLSILLAAGVGYAVSQRKKKGKTE